MIETSRLHEPYEVDDLVGADVLQAVRDAEVQSRQAERRTLRLAARWCRVRPGSADAFAPLAHGFGLDDVHIAGEGTPLVAAGAPEAFAAAKGVSVAAGQAWLADALDLTFRLPRILARVDELEVPVWKARKVARMTRVLPFEAARLVDGELADRLHNRGLKTIEQVVDTALAAFCPEVLAEREKRGRSAWRVRLHDRGEDGWQGTSILDAVGDTADFRDFHALVSAVADRLADLGDEDTADQRRARALGVIGRGEHMALMAEPSPSAGADGEPSTGSSAVVSTVPGAAVSRRLFVHFSAEDLAATRSSSPTSGGDAATGAAPVTVDVETLGKATEHLVKGWFCNGTGTSGAAPRVRVTPVVDLNRNWSVDRHDPPPAMREQVVLRDPHCIHPYCEVDARLCDLDHIEPYRPHGPPGQTRPDNLAPLCRRGHNCKTHLGWSYVGNRDGSYTWTDPDGLRYLVTPERTLPIV